MNRDEIMRQWDYWRKAIANGDTSSAPRDWFESLIDASSTKAEMNRDDVLSAAKEAGWAGIYYPQWASQAPRGSVPVPVAWVTCEQVERFAAIIEKRTRESEREACAKVCELKADEYATSYEGSHEGSRMHGKMVAANTCATAIRALGEIGTIKDSLTVGETGGVK